MKKLVLAVLLSATSLLSTSPAFAATDPTPTGTCQPIFGGGSTCSSSGNLLVNKTIKSPNGDTYADSLGVDTPFQPNQDVTFRIVVTNNNNSTLSKVTIADYFPDFVTFTKGDGTFDTDTRTLTITIDKLQGNESKTYTLTGRIQGSDVFPSNQPVTCLANHVQVTAGARKSTDNVQFCVQTGQLSSSTTMTTTPTQPQTTTQTKPSTSTSTTNTNNTTKGGNPINPVYPAPATTSTPNTGPELFGLIGLFPLAGSGLYLRRKAKLS